MHEIVLAKEIIKRAKEHGSVKSITVEVGELAHVPLEDIKRIIEEMVDWKCNFEQKNAVVMCNCGFKGRPKVIEHTHEFCLFKCSECKAELPKILEGQDIVLKEVETE